MLDRRFDIRRPGSGRRTEHVGDHFFSGERCERQRPNELLRRMGHDDLHTNAAVLEEAHDFRRLISCHPTGHAQRDFHSRKAAATASTSSPAYRIDAAARREIQTPALAAQTSNADSQLSLPAIRVYASSANTLFRVSLAATTGNFGISGISHLTLPALISSCAMRQGLRDPVSITGGAPPCSCRARRAATRM